MNEEINEFIKTHDRYGKDRALYDELVQKHVQAREQFKQHRKNVIEEYKAMKERESSEDKGLR